MINVNVGENILWHNLDDLIPVQGDLKELTQENYLKLKSELLAEGFCSPFFVWHNEQGRPEILDGHQRRTTLITMRDTDNIEMPDKFPCCEIKAPTRERAMKILLALTSQYGTITPEGLHKYLMKNDISVDEAVNRFHMDKFDMVEIKETQFGEVSEVEMPELPTGDKGELEQITFTLHSEQAETIRRAMALCNQKYDADSELNENKNGNALSYICELFITRESAHER
jgi:hypothetical protein